MGYILKGVGHAVDMAEDGAAAVAAVQRENYDVVLMDIQMPGMDGYQATARIRALPDDRCHTPIIAMTANAMPDDVSRCIAAGMDAHLPKPIEKPALLQMLARWTDRKSENAGAAATAPMGIAMLLDADHLAGLERQLGREQVIGFAQMLLDHLPPAAEKLRSAAARDDRAMIRSETHALVSLAGNLGAQNLCELSRTLTREATHDAAHDAIVAAVGEIVATADRTATALHERYPETSSTGANPAAASEMA